MEREGEKEVENTHSLSRKGFDSEGLRELEEKRKARDFFFFFFLSKGETEQVLMLIGRIHV